MLTFMATKKVFINKKVSLKTFAVALNKSDHLVKIKLNGSKNFHESTSAVSIRIIDKACIVGVDLYCICYRP